MIPANTSSEQVSFIFPLSVMLVCIAPFLLNQLGFDFSSQSFSSSGSRSGLGTTASTDDYFYFLRGAFTHTLLEWSACMIALCVAILALVHYRVVNDVTTLVIGVALLASGCMDAFHTLAADRLIEAAVDNQQLIPFTWAIARVFEAIILMLGVGLFLRKPTEAVKQHFKLAMFVCVAIVGITYGLIHYCSTASSLPQTLYPDSLVTRPWDVAPLILFIFVGLFLFPRYYHQHPSLFSLSLIVSFIPQIILELHMVFGSSALFDNHFNIAHFLKIIAYLVPFIGMVMDYSYSHRVQTGLLEQLTNTKAHAQSILDTAVDGIISIDDKGSMLSANPMAQKIFGYDLTELVGQNVKMLMPDPYQSEHDSYLSNYATTDEKKIIGIGREVIGKRKDGSTFPMDLSVAEVIEGEGSTFTGFVRDISERKKLEKELIERDELFSTFVNSSPTLMWMTDKDNMLVMFNDSWLSFLGTELEDNIARPWDGQSIHQDCKDECLQLYSEKITAKKPFDHELKMIDQDGQCFWFREVGIPRFNNDKFQGYIGNLINITDRKIMEKGIQDSMDKLLKSNEELEQFAYVASHDLQEPLRMVASYTQLLSRRYKGKLDEDADEFISYAVDGAKRMQGLIKDLLEYSRVGSQGQHLLPVDSGEVLSEVIANLSMAIDDAGISLTYDEMPVVLADDHQLLQLLQNLIGNAIKYRDPEKAGEIHIGVNAEEHHWVFAVKDNGIGIESQFFEQIFVIFKRLHAPGEQTGSGIGLSICKKIIERHGGDIWLESEPGKGSTFFFKLQKYEEIRI